MNLAVQSFKPYSMIDLESLIRTVPDFPKPGIQFRDITPILANPKAYSQLIDQMSQQVKLSGANVVVGLESRGFVFGVSIAERLALPFVPARKAGKLPGDTVKADYSLEYGKQSLELQLGSIKPDDKVAIVDDLLATGGTVQAAKHLISTLGGQVAGYFFAIELLDLNGRQVLDHSTVESVMKF
jgi:adenine phosphoribosyltransferase